MMDGIADAIKLGTKIVGVLERLTTDTDIKAEFQERGFIRGTFTLGNYGVEFSVYDKKKTAIPAEVENVETAGNEGDTP